MAKRRQFIVNRFFQLKYTLMIALLGGLISAIFTAWMWSATRATSEFLLIGEIPGAELIRDQIRADQAHLPWLYITITILMMCALGILGILITHRVAGPAFVMARYLSVVADGAYPSVRPLRKRDELKEFFEVFEKTIAVLKDRDKVEANKLDSVIKELESAGAPAEQINVLKAIRDRKRDSIAGDVDPEEDLGEESIPSKTA